MRDTGAAVVADDCETLVPQRCHQPDLVGGHRALAIRRVVSVRGWLARVAVPAQIRHDHGVRLGQCFSYIAPDHVSLGIAM